MSTPYDDTLEAPPHPFDEEASVLSFPLPMRLEYFLTEAQASDWFSNQAIDTFSAYKSNPQVWGRILQAAKERFISPKQLEAAVVQRLLLLTPQPAAPPHGLVTPPHSLATEAVSAAVEPWRQGLQCSAKGEPKETLGNMGLIFHNHTEWSGTLWWDELQGQAMCRSEPVNDDFVTDAAQWLCVVERMPVKSPRMVERVLRNEARRVRRDTLQEYILQALPAWDKVERLDYWLADCASLTPSPYIQAVSRIIPLSMVARALDPGCLYRYVVILEGPEEIGKSSLVRALAGEQGYVELSMGLESKEAHMMLRGVWVAELAELDSLSRTEETRLKSFITMREDSYIPKYTNDRVSIPRRTVFIGTTNEDSYLKGQTGNSRYLPVRLQSPLDISIMSRAREQILAEALVAYQATGARWWQINLEALNEAQEIRDDRRIVNEYEDPLRDWLERRGETRVTWEEIARDFLEIPTKERWKDRSLSMQIAAAMRAIGWQRVRFILNENSQRTFKRGYEKKKAYIANH